MSHAQSVATPAYNMQVVRQFAIMTVVWGIVGIRIRHDVLRPHQGRFQQALITHAFAPAVRGKAFTVEQNQRLLANPAPAHLASW